MKVPINECKLARHVKKKGYLQKIFKYLQYFRDKDLHDLYNGPFTNKKIYYS